MRNENLLGLPSRPEGLYDFIKSEPSLKNLLNSGRFTPELIALKTMAEMIQSYCQDILRLEKEFKKLRDQESSQELANLHMRHRMEEIEESIKRSNEGLAALRADYSMYRTFFLKQSGKATKALTKPKKSLPQTNRKAKKA